jgi:hypothetical protein
MGVANAYYQEFVERFSLGELLVSVQGTMLPSGGRRTCVVYPNPASQWIRIAAPATQVPRHLRLVDAAGRQIREVLPPGTRSIDIRGLPEGIYFLHITLDKGEQSVHKILVIR